MIQDYRIFKFYSFNHVFKFLIFVNIPSKTVTCKLNSFWIVIEDHFSMNLISTGYTEKMWPSCIFQN